VIRCGPWTPVEDPEKTPAAQAGLLIGPPGCDGPVRYDPAAQDWYPAGPDAGPDFFFGFDRNRPPGPGDLQRVEILAGAPVRLGDGAEWIIPIARQLPRRRTLSRDGHPEARVLEKFAALFDMALEVWDQYDRLARIVRARQVAAEPEADDLASAMTPEREEEILVAAIRANYRIGYWETRALGLLDDNCEQEILRVLIDWDSMMAIHLDGLAAAADDFSQEAETKKKPGPEN